MNDNDVVLVGLKETKKALKDHAPELLKAMNKEIKGIGNDLSSFARTKIPESSPARGWRTVPAASPRSRGGAGWPAWNPGEMKKGVKFKTGGTKKKGSATQSAYSLINESAAGAIFEIAGRSASGSGSGVSLINDLNQTSKASRIIWSALDERGKREVAEAIEEVIKHTDSKLQDQLNSANDRDVIK